MRVANAIAIPAVLWVFCSAMMGCGDSSKADDLFGPSSSNPSSGTGGSSATGGSGGAGGTSSGGTGGTSPTGGYGGSAPSGGYGGSAPSGGYGGSVPTGGYAGSVPSGGFGGTGGADTGGSGGSGQTGGVGGGGQPLGEVPCPSNDPNAPDACPVPNQVCCLSFGDNQAGVCLDGNQAGTCETDIGCNAPADCPANMLCCGHLVAWNNTWRYDQVRCQATCDGTDDVVFCDPYDATISCAYGQSCDTSAILPDGYYVCQ